MDQTSNQGGEQGGTAPQGAQTPQQAPAPHAQAGDNSMIMGILAYLGPLVLIPLLVEKNNPFVKYHVKQGLVIFAIEVVIMVVGGMFMIYGITQILNLAMLILSILGIVNVVNKKQEPVPVVGQFSHYFDGIVK